MNMQQFTGWVTRLLNALPWRRTQRPPTPLTRERVTAPPRASHFTVSDDQNIRRQKAETNPLCSTLHDDVPADHAPPTPPLLPATDPPESSSAPLMAVPALPTMGTSDAAQPEPGDEARLFQADPERRLAFARFLFRRGVFNEGFPGETVPAQYRDQAGQNQG